MMVFFNGRYHVCIFLCLYVDHLQRNEFKLLPRYYVSYISTHINLINSKSEKIYVTVTHFYPRVCFSLTV